MLPHVPGQGKLAALYNLPGEADLLSGGVQRRWIVHVSLEHKL